MKNDEEFKEARLHLISALKELLKTYESEKGLVEAEVNYLEHRMAVLRNQVRLYDVSSAITKMRLMRLGVRGN